VSETRSAEAGPATASSPVAEAAALGLLALAETVARTQAGITVTDAERRYVYANPAACQMLGYPLELLRGRDLLESFPVREHATMLAHLPHQLDDGSALFTCIMLDADGAEHEIVYSTFAVDVEGSLHGVGILRDVTGPRTAARTAAALAQTAAQLVGTASTSEILAGIARHAVEGTRALVCGIPVVDSDHELASVGSHLSPSHGLSASSAKTRNAAWDTFAGIPGEEVVHAMTAGTILIGEVPGKPVVLSDARSIWEADPVTQGFAATMQSIGWQAGVFVPLSSEDRVFGFLGILLPSGLSGPSEAELAFYTALADQAAVVVTNARLSSQAAQAAAVLERTRLARDLHDSVSQALFSMTMHARAAQLAMANAGLDETGPLGRSIFELAGLTRGAMAEMRALIFELRPGALAEEGLVAALSKQGAALTAREQVVITVEGPEQRLELSTGVEEHLYRIVSEALHNVVKHARADTATVRITAHTGILRLAVRDDGAGFDQNAEHPGHLGLTTMAERAAVIGASLAVSSAPGAGTTVAVSLSHDTPDESREGSRAG
jgi:PAS domain S-box-containing protein